MPSEIETWEDLMDPLKYTRALIRLLEQSRDYQNDCIVIRDNARVIELIKRAKEELEVIK